MQSNFVYGENFMPTPVMFLRRFVASITWGIFILVFVLRSNSFFVLSLAGQNMKLCLSALLQKIPGQMGWLFLRETPLGFTPGFTRFMSFLCIGKAR